jgi:hypothetical protein
MAEFERPHPETIEALRRLRDQAFERGDETLGLMLAGVDLYIAAGRERELLETMRDFARRMERADHESTPSAEDLRRWWEME